MSEYQDSPQDAVLTDKSITPSEITLALNQSCISWEFNFLFNSDWAFSLACLSSAVLRALSIGGVPLGCRRMRVGFKLVLW